MRARRLHGDFIVFHTAGLPLPKKEMFASEYHMARQPLEALIGRAVLYVIAAIAREVAFADPAQFCGVSVRRVLLADLLRRRPGPRPRYRPRRPQARRRGPARQPRPGVCARECVVDFSDEIPFDLFRSERSPHTRASNLG
jgi:hypothetical protein